MLDFGALKTAKKKSDVNVVDRKKEADEIYKTTFEEFVKIYSLDDETKLNYNKLEEIANQFNEVIERDSKKVEAYVCLSYIFLLIQDEENAYNIFQVAESIDPNSVDVIDLKKIFNQGE